MGFLEEHILDIEAEATAAAVTLHTIGRETSCTCQINGKCLSVKSKLLKHRQHPSGSNNSKSNSISSSSSSGHAQKPRWETCKCNRGRAIEKEPRRSNRKGCTGQGERVYKIKVVLSSMCCRHLNAIVDPGHKSVWPGCHQECKDCHAVEPMRHWTFYLPASVRTSIWQKDPKLMQAICNGT